MMVAITVHQPWAYAIARLGKAVENRDWMPHARNLGRPMAIHAGKKLDEEAVLDLRAEGMAVPDEMALGAVVAVARLIGIVEIETNDGGCRVVASMRPEAEVREAALSHDALWFCGRYGWVFGRRVELPEPVACRGAQGLWPLPADVETAVREQISALRSAGRA